MLDSDPVVGNYYNKHATRNPVERLLVNRFENTLKELISKTHPQRVIEIGCGEGHVVQIVKHLYPRCHYTAVDIDHDLLLAARDRGADETFLAPLQSVGLPYHDHSFDLVLMVEVLEHLGSPFDGLLEANRLSSSHLIATVPNEPIWRVLNILRFKYVGSLGNTPGHLHHWGKQQFRKFISSQFDPMTVKSPLPWIMILGKKI